MRKVPEVRRQRCDRALRAAVLSLALLGSHLPSIEAQEGPAAIPIVIRGVAVVDVEHGRVVPDRTVTLQGNRIVAVTGAAPIPDVARVIEGEGRYLMPGLWDMHGHVLPAHSDQGQRQEWWEPESRPAFKLLLANGVTGVRDMWGTLEAAAQVRRERAATAAVWPRLLTPGGIIDGPEPFHPGLIPVSSESDARRAVDSLIAGGADFIKVYTSLPADLYREVLRYAASRGVRVAGHVPSAVRAEDAALAGQVSFEHLYGVLEGCSDVESDLINDNITFLDERAAHRSDPARDRAYFQRLLDTQNESRCRDLLDLLARRDVWQVPTLTAHHGVFRLREAGAADDPRLVYIHPMARSQWQPVSYDETRSFGSADWELRRERWQRILEVVEEMQDRGVPLLAGSDFHPTVAFTFPGFGLHEELELLVRAGLSPGEALRAATLNPARFLGAADSLGTVAPGMLADLVLLNANPLDDIGNTRSIQAVAVNGVWLDRRGLDDMLSEVADHYAASAGRPTVPLPGGAERTVDFSGSTTGIRYLFLVDPALLRGSIPTFLEPFTAADLSLLDASTEVFLAAQPQYRGWVLAGLDIALADSVRVDEEDARRHSEARWWVETRGSDRAPGTLPADIETRAEIEGWSTNRSPGTRVSARRFGSGTWVFEIESMALRVDAVCSPGGARAPVGVGSEGLVLVWQGGEVPDRYTVRAPGDELVRDCDLRVSAEGLHPLAVALRQAPPVRGVVLGARLVESRSERRGVYRVD